VQNFMQIPPREASRQMVEICAKIFLAVHIPFFQKLTYTGHNLRPIFARDGSNDAVSRKDVPFGGKKI